ncbi:pyrimidine 5'-nucleotidase [Aliivibrio sp. S3MY1]|uniref:pyrimidine 5'-nucleotidase n=1 Tax=unclassified Aliivibrio TaxID=2645654 RepID=UPI002379F9D9|nr:MULTISPECIES: pyrimidine 5'-nucleotidase [unclassified Aliivibrio]MDD9194347.1 pyrimidine 5'-nucleotidase [Aliivibrio sp. S3MY1]MDD9198015.1 pyrimidine 5'-nucleotidase [Aliivibrio sp. S2MY1]
MKYQWILFDADETLFHFDAFAGLQRMFKGYGIDFSKEQFIEYQLVNKPLWEQYQDNEITAQQLQETRFKEWANKVGVTPRAMNSAFMMAMAEICIPLDGARELLDSLLANNVKMGIITNGFTELQKIRLEKTEFSHYFELITISEQVGVAKPDKRIFEHTFSQMGSVDLSKVLMVGDNPDSDILGGMNAGVDTCWLNASHKACSEGIKPTYTVKTLNDLQVLLHNA